MTNTARNAFTIVEIIITVVLTGVFIILLSSTMGAISAQQHESLRYASATEIARTNLNKFRYYSEECTDETEVRSILGSRAEPRPAGKFPNFIQKVTVQWPQGCDEVGTITSTVQYGPVGAPEIITLSSYTSAS